ncbi:MAG: ParB N-terminal domain-containing protein [Gammaproteobacteria bacterium]|nr:ParB N-terminal domain-containing protein [Gammaproteobacteria bacterium]
MRLHTYCLLIPEMSPDDFNLLKRSIKERGQLVPIVTLDDAILDGRHRYKACKSLGITPKFEPYEGSDPLGYVLALNDERRHLSKSQKAMLGASIATLKRGEVGISRQASIKGNHVANSNTKLGLPNGGSNFTVEQAAKKMAISSRSIERAKHLKETAPSNLINLVESGQVTIGTAQKAVDVGEPELLSTASASQLKDMLNAVNTGLESSIRQTKDLAVRFADSYEKLSKFDKTDELMAAVFDINFYLRNIALAKQRIEKNDVARKATSPEKYNSQSIV